MNRTVLNSTIKDLPSRENLILLFYRISRSINDFLIYYNDFFGFLETEENVEASIKTIKEKMKLKLEVDLEKKYSEIFYKHDLSGNGYWTEAGFLKVIDEMELDCSQISLKLFFNHYQQKGIIGYESLINSISPEYFVEMTTMEILIISLKQWVIKKEFTEVTLLDKLKEFTGENVSVGITRRGFRLFFTELKIPLIEANWETLMDYFKANWSESKIDIVLFIKTICEKQKQTNSEKKLEEIKGMIRKIIGLKGDTYKFVDDFRKYDRLATHYVSGKDFRLILDLAKIPLTDEQFNLLQSKFDPNFTEKVAYHEFLNYLQLSPVEMKNMMDSILTSLNHYVGIPIELFQRFDINNDNTIRITDFQYCLKTIGVVLNDFEMYSLINQYADIVNVRSINYINFLKYFFKDLQPIQQPIDPLNLIFNKSCLSIAPQLYKQYLNKPEKKDNTTRVLEFAVKPKLSPEFVEQQNKLYECASSVYKATGYFTCPVCEYKQTQKYMKNCEICGSLNPFEHIISKLIICQKCSYKNSPYLKKCELCKSTLDNAESKIQNVGEIVDTIKSRRYGK